MYRLELVTDGQSGLSFVRTVGCAIVEAFGGWMLFRRWMIGAIFWMMTIHTTLARDVLVAFHLSRSARITRFVFPLLPLFADKVVDVLLGDGLPRRCRFLRAQRIDAWSPGELSLQAVFERMRSGLMGHIHVDLLLRNDFFGGFSGHGVGWLLPSCDRPTIGCR